MRLSLAVATMLIASPALGCGPTTDCMVEMTEGERSYRISIPEGVAKPGAVIFAHGYRGTAAGVMRNRGMVNGLNRRGVAFVAVQAGDEDWQLENRPRRGPNVEGQKREMAYFEKLKVDLVAKHGIDGDNIMVSGFSAGGMVTWTVACTLGDTFSAYAPFAGTFWAPVPESCAQLPVPMIHIHGTSDKVVPMKGRKIANTRQGDVYKSLNLMAGAGGYGDWRSIGERNGLTCQQQDGDEDRPFLQLCLHPGGHTFRSEWMGETWDEFVKAGVLK